MVSTPKSYTVATKYHRFGQSVSPKCTNKEDNTSELLVALKALQKDIKKVDKTHVLYVDDGPALATSKPGCLTLQCTDTAMVMHLHPLQMDK